ncbi:MAG: ATPase, partial [Candidatus Micrarchaeaceae archaeon]
MATLEWLRQECMKLYPQRHIELETGVAEEEIPENLKVNIFRIAQEALNNIAKHSKAEWVD